MHTLSTLLQEGPNGDLSWVLWVVLGLIVLIIVVAWMYRRMRSNQPFVQTEERLEEEMPIAREKSPDDLTKIEGIGPKVASILNEIGIVTYEDLANADEARVQEALDDAGLQMMDPEGWIKQAKLAAKGDMEGLAKLQDEMEGGRMTS